MASRAGDFDGDDVDDVVVFTGRDTVGVKQAAGSTWSLRHLNSAGAGDTTLDFGFANDLPVRRCTG